MPFGIEDILPALADVVDAIPTPAEIGEGIGDFFGGDDPEPEPQLEGRSDEPPADGKPLEIGDILKRSVGGLFGILGIHPFQEEIESVTKPGGPLGSLDKFLNVAMVGIVVLGVIVVVGGAIYVGEKVT